MITDRRITALRVVVISDGSGDPARIERLARDCTDGGVRAFQLREPRLDAASLARLCERLRPAFDAVDGLLIVNDRADVAAAGLAHGVHLGHHSLPPARVRAFAGADLIIGVSTHSPREVDAARLGHADYVSLSPVFPTASKPGAEHLGEARAAEWTRSAGIPVVWLGGLDAQRITALGDPVPAIGFAVLGAVCRAADPRAASQAIVRSAAHRRMGTP